MNEDRYWFEDVPEEERFYFLVQYTEYEPKDEEEYKGGIFAPDPKIEERIRRQHEVGFVPGTLNPPAWSDVEDRPDPQTPRIFTKRELAEERRRYHDDPDSEIQVYTQLVEDYGEEATNQAFNKSAPLRVVWKTREDVLDALGDADFSHLLVDDQIVSKQAFARELSEKLKEDS